jgi:hypothetical protein
MKRVFLSIVLAGAVSSAFAQKSEVTAAKTRLGFIPANFFKCINAIGKKA